ncbi:MAG: transcriptional repressor [Parcubacteria group bacterium]|nr:transcriptional repressor [Parcubacteria group bacterium]
MERITSQKKIIIDYLKSVKTHPSAEKVYLEARKKLPQISQGTVYRILNGLKEKGMIQELTVDVSYFDAETSSHGHFVCKKCDSIYDIFGKFCNINCKGLKTGTVTNFQIYLYGVCEKCQDKK